MDANRKPPSRDHSDDDLNELQRSLDAMREQRAAATDVSLTAEEKLHEVFFEAGRVEASLRVMGDLILRGHLDAAREMAEDLRRSPEEWLPFEGTEARQWVVTHLASSLALTMDAMAVKNCIEWKLTMPDGRKMVLSAQWQHGKTPMDLRREAEQERDEARAALEGNTAAPTDAEIDALEAAGGHWFVMLDWSDGGALVPNLYDAERAREKVRGALDTVPRVVAWRAIDREGRPFARPQVTR